VTGNPSREIPGAPPLPDREERELVTSLLDRNLMVEAAAGTGKTTAMIGRMLALLGSGACRHIRHMAAITFTRKAAAEIRGRFRSSLEEACREARGRERENLESALENAEQCFIGTIHSFCARILREKPLEAGVGLSFREIDDLEDSRLREEAWNRFCARLFIDDPGDILGRLREVGVRLSDLETAFQRFADFPDVEEWPIPDPAPTEGLFDRARRELEEYLNHISRLIPKLPLDPGNDKLIPELRRAVRVVSHYRLENPAELMEALEFFDRGISIVLSAWERGKGLSRETAKEEKNRWERFRRETVRPALSRWRETRYAVCLEALNSARETYDLLRREREVLNFQDLLTAAARLLRENPEARRELQARFTHLLVDEFQDTDPLQAEMIFLLVSSDVSERDWRRCQPRPGSLFLVGDPKQSIYRFRRADISIYNEVKEIMMRSGGLVLTLTSNFRSPPELVEWVNEVFSPQGNGDVRPSDVPKFPAQATEFSPAYVNLVPSRIGPREEGLRGVYRLTVPPEFSRNEEALQYMADRIARFIRDACSGGLTLYRHSGNDGSIKTGAADPSDFLVLTYRRDDLAVFAERLHDHGIPCRTSGGQSLNRVSELQLLKLCIKVVLRPYDPLALVALLRSELFGFSDAELYEFKRAGGSFLGRRLPASGLDPETAEAFADAFRRLEEFRRWFRTMPLMAALELVVHDLGLMLSAALRPGGEMQAGSLAKALELVRETQDEIWTGSQLLGYLQRLAENRESYDGISALSEDPPAVRVMNLHRAKGLEAPVVFLAGVSGGGNRDPDIHVARGSRVTQGYLGIYRETSAYSRTPVAHPAEWETVSDRERAFLEAESLRLMYVAATRASGACIVSVREGNDRHHPWRLFYPYLKRAPELPELSPSVAAGAAPAAPDRQAFEDWAREAPWRKETVLRPTYEVVAAKRHALGHREEEPPGTAEGGYYLEEISIQERGDFATRGAVDSNAGPHSPSPPAPHPPYTATREAFPEDESEAADLQGTDFGEVVHMLLQAAMERPSARLETLALPFLEERGLDPALAGTAASLVRKAMRSALWKRARASARCLTEVPFHFLKKDSGGVPTLVRGVVDLAFLEDGGWVLVDYKTDRVSEDDARKRAEKYLPQLRLYSEVWEKILGEPVKEALIYLVEAGRLYRVRRGR